MYSKIFQQLKDKGLMQEALYVQSLEKMNDELIRERDRYKSIVDDIKKYETITPRVKEELYDL